MVFAIALLGLVFVLALLFKVLPLKFVGALLCLCALIGTFGIFFMQPKMHKPFSIDIIEYLVKFNDDGTMTTTKQTTKTILKRDLKEDEQK